MIYNLFFLVLQGQGQKWNSCWRKGKYKSGKKIYEIIMVGHYRGHLFDLFNITRISPFPFFVGNDKKVFKIFDRISGRFSSYDSEKWWTHGLWATKKGGLSRGNSDGLSNFIEAGYVRLIKESTMMKKCRV